MTQQKNPAGNATPASKYSAAWSRWISFESEAAHMRRTRLEDPFNAAPMLETLIARSEAGDSTAAYAMYSFARYTEERGPWAVIPSFEQQGPAAPKNWTPVHKEHWMRVAARGGYWVAAFAALEVAKHLAPDDPRRTEISQEAIDGLEIAARRGSLEALQTLSSQYQGGEFVDQNLPRAFAYLQVIALAAPEGKDYWAGRAEELRPSLSEEALQRVADIQAELARCVSSSHDHL